MAVLLGRQSAGTTGDFNGDSHCAVWKFTAVASGQLAVIKAQTKVANTASSVKFGIYADSAGSPGALMTSQAVDVLADANGTGVASATLASPQTIVSGTDYWLGWRAVGDNRNFQGDSSGSYQENNGTVDFPNPFGGSSPGSVNAIIWGESTGGIPDRAGTGTIGP